MSDTASSQSAGGVPTDPTDSIPEELRRRAQWVVWRLQYRKTSKGWKLTKVPFRADLPEAEASSTDPATWSTFDSALAASRDPANKLDGIGYVFSADDDLAGVDFDNCLDRDGNVQEWARPSLDRLVGYAEVSPSGRGVKVFVRGSVPGGRGRKLQALGPDGKGAIEAYDRGRYFTVTGNLLDDDHAIIGDGSAELAELHAGWFPPKPARKRVEDTAPSLLSDDDLIRKAERAANGAKFSALMDGSTEGHPSKSEADLALLSHLGFWTGGDIGAMDRIFRRSRLCDEKWTERPDYRERTIARALEGQSTYDPAYRSNGRPEVNGHRSPEARVDGPPPESPSAEPGPVASGPIPNEADDDPHRLARIYRDTHCYHDDGPTLVYHQGEFLRWDRAYRPVPIRDVNASLASAVKVEFDRLNVEKQAGCDPGKLPKVVKVTSSLVNNVSLALAGYSLVQGHVESPSWLSEPAPWPASEVLPTRNALVHLPSFVSGKPARIAPTPNFFCLHSTDYDFEPKAPTPSRWLDLLHRDFWTDDPQSPLTLQEWFGYHLTPDTRQQKIGMVIGPKRSGKGTIARVLKALIGASNVCHPTLSGLGTQFGSAILIGKLAAFVTDARLSGRSDIAQIVENLLSISGEDGKSIHRKHMADWDGKLMAKFTIFSNETPQLADASGALPGRMIMFRLTRSFYGHEDTELFDKLLPELPGILLWAIDGWKRLRERGHFIQPESGRQLVEEMEELSSPVRTFVEDCCEVGPGHQVEIRKIFQAWKAWCQEKNREHVGNEQTFGRNLGAVIPTLGKPKQRRDGRERIRVYEGIDLLPPNF